MRKLVTRFLALFRTGAKTVGLSPKTLGTFIGATVTALVNLLLSKLGLTLQDVADFIGTSPQYIVAAQVVAAGWIAAWLLPPGTTTGPEGVVDGVMATVDVNPPPAPRQR